MSATRYSNLTTFSVCAAVELRDAPLLPSCFDDLTGSCYNQKPELIAYMLGGGGQDIAVQLHVYEASRNEHLQLLPVTSAPSADEANLLVSMSLLRISGALLLQGKVCSSISRM